MAALVYQGYAFFTGGKTLLAAISFALLVLAVMMVADSIRAVRRGKPEAGVGVAGVAAR